MAFVATDTLAVDESGTPLNWTTKAIHIPHMRMIVAGTGLAGICSAWFSIINERMAVRGIESLNKFAQGQLKSLYNRCLEEIGFPQGITTTIYHFGFSEDTNQVVAFAYRSTNDFRSERLGYGMHAKPACNFETEAEFPLSIIEMMKSQRELEAAKPASERLHIGGEIQVLHMTPQGTNSVCMYRFDDADAMDTVIRRNAGT
ncbi:hypothetical protein [Comamonas thiooxydans]